MNRIASESAQARQPMLGRIAGIHTSSGVASLALLRALVAAAIMSAGSLVMLVLGAATLFRARRWYAAGARVLSRAILRLYGVRFIVHAAEPLPRRQVVYVSNHTSTLDLFLLAGMGLPNTRFFLSGFLRTFVPLGIIAWLMGTFFTVPQDRPAERTRIFQRAARVLRRTGESVYLSPEGGRITTGEIGHFNKGAFHLATELHAPIVPLFLQIPRTMDPGLGLDAKPGTVHIHVLRAIETRDWTVDALPQNVQRVRDVFVKVHAELPCA